MTLFRDLLPKNLFATTNVRDQALSRPKNICDDKALANLQKNFSYANKSWFTVFKKGYYSAKDIPFL